MRLKELHHTLSRAEREAMALAAGIKPEYLAQLASGFKKNPPLRLCAALVAHDGRLTLDELADEFAEESKA
jgi:DNA-binding transcriptional regulator YdaS (Cro superfamily)